MMTQPILFARSGQKMMIIKSLAMDKINARHDHLSRRDEMYRNINELSQDQSWEGK
jgi:hypothetical protein